MTRRAKGTGTIYKREGKNRVYWEAQVTTGYDPGSGKQLRKTFTGATQKEVRDKMQKAAVAVQSGEYFDPVKMTLGEWLEVWQADYSADWKYLTKKKYKSICDNHIKPALGAVKLPKLTTPQIQRFYNSLDLSPKSIHLVHGVLSKALNTAVDIGYIKTNTAEKCKIPKLIKKEVNPLTEEQIKALITACESEEYGRIYKLILFTGLREGEVLGLTWECVDFDSKTIKVNKQLQRQDGKNVLVPLKNSKPRTLVVPDAAISLLQESKVYQIEQRLKAGEIWEGWPEGMEKALVFLKADGKPITAAALYQRFKAIAESIGAGQSRVHDLRHTYAVLALQNGDSPKTVQDNLGHATAAFTLDIYGHVSERMKEDSAARMQAYIEEL